MRPRASGLDRTAASTFGRVAVDLAHEAFPEMAEALRERLARILVRWRELSLQAMPHLDQLTLVQFEDGVGEILTAAAEAFASAEPLALRRVLETGPQHGVDRFLQAHSMLDLFEEVRILRGVVIVEMGEQMRRPLETGEAATFHATFDLIVQLGVMTLMDEQASELQAAQATMREVTEHLIVSSVRQSELAQRADEAHAALRQSEARFRMLADNMSQLAWTCDTLGNVTWYNRRWLEYTGLSFEEMKGWAWSKVQHPDHLERVMAHIRRSAAAGTPWEDTFPLRGADGQYRWFLSRATPIRDESGDLVCWFGTNTDISDRIALENRVREQADALAGESRRKDEFLAMLSHELRNPLAPIHSSLELMRLAERTGGEPAIQLRAREVIERQVANLTRLVSDLLEVSRLASGRVRLERQTVDVNEVIRHAVETTLPLFEQRRHELGVFLAAEPLWCDLDATRMEEVFINLLNNAAKYTPDGGRVEVRCERQAGRDAVEVRVRDTGTGIDADLLPRIFDLFTQADRSLARAGGGLGVGLSLASRLVDLHGGTLEACSPRRDGLAGSEFIVRLPLTSGPRRPDGPAPAARRSARPSELRVLVVDDNVDWATTLTALLRYAGHRVQTAFTGPDGLKMALDWQPDTVLLDIGLPGLDGYEVARRLRLDPRAATMRLIALTGYGRESDQERAREAGFDAHATKPVAFDQLERLVGTVPGPETLV